MQSIAKYSFHLVNGQSKAAFSILFVATLRSTIVLIQGHAPNVLFPIYGLIPNAFLPDVLSLSVNGKPWTLDENFYSDYTTFALLSHAVYRPNKFLNHLKDCCLL